MTCADFQERAAAYALGALDPDERAACEAHLNSTAAHDGCLEALRQANEAAALLARALPPVSPSPATWQAIERRIAASAPAPTRSFAARLGWVVAAACALLLVWLVRDRAQRTHALSAKTELASAEAARRSQCVADLEKLRAADQLRDEAIALLQLPGTRLVTLAPQAGQPLTASVILPLHQQRALLVGKGLLAPAGKDYELWIIRGARKIPAGLLRGGSSGALITAIDPALLAGAPPDALAVTLEPAGGGAAPRGPIVLVGKVI